MNFIIKNIGWLLLVLFFLFMLFVISSNEGEKKASINSGTILEEGTKEIEDLDSLVEMMGKTTQSLEKEETETEKADKTEKIKEETTKNIKGEEQGFFSRIFGKKENKGEKKNDSENLNAEEVSNNQEERTDNTREISESGNKRELGNLKKYSGLKQKNSLAAQYAPEVLENMYPGIHLETAIGKEFEIGVHSLKLNNAYFNETLAYMSKGDRVTQLTKENSYGCFQVELEKSKKKGYVCKKYLQNTTEAKKGEQERLQNVNNIGDIITIEADTVTFGNNITLLKGDTVDQMTDVDAQGCFIAHVYSSSVKQNTAPVGKVCYKDIK